MEDFSKLNRKERRDLLAKTITLANYKLRKLDKIKKVLMKYVNDKDLMALIRHDQHKDKSLHIQWKEARELTLECKELYEKLAQLTNGSNRPRHSNKKSA